jgi:plastocyanin
MLKGLLVGLTGVALLGCSHLPSGGGARPAATLRISAADPVAVSELNFSFSPATLAVPRGTTVVWTNASATAHTTTSDTGLWDSGSMAPGQTFSYTFSQPGRYPYHCAPHQAMGMVGTIVVQ